MGGHGQFLCRPFVAHLLPICWVPDHLHLKERWGEARQLRSYFGASSRAGGRSGYPGPKTMGSLCCGGRRAPPQPSLQFLIPPPATAPPPTQAEQDAWSHVANDGDEEYAGEYDDDDFDDDDEEIPPMPTCLPPPVPRPPIRLVARGGGTQPLPPRERILGLTLEDAI